MYRNINIYVPQIALKSIDNHKQYRLEWQNTTYNFLQLAKSYNLNYLSFVLLKLFQQLYFQPAINEEVIRYTRLITSTAVGNEFLSSKMISQSLLIIIQFLEHSTKFPCFKSFKSHLLILLPSISILPFLLKVLDDIAYTQLSDYYRANNLCFSIRFSFRS